jgi:parallel beta-helix repeat protein
MCRGLVLAIVLVILLSGWVGITLKVERVRASGTIYIRADGSVDPSSAPISTIDNITYTLTSDIYDSIRMERDNIILDGVGYKIQGTGSEKGIDLSGRTNVTINGTSIKSFYFGIYLDQFSSGNIISKNKIKNCQIGIEVYGHYNIISENDIANNYQGIELRGASNTAILGNNITTNTGNGISLAGYELDPDLDIVISGNTITKNNEGISLGDSKNTSVVGNNITENNSWGIELYGSNNNISQNLFSQNVGGIYIFGSNHNISGNNVSDNNYYGILIQDSTGNMLRSNSITRCNYNLGVKGSRLSDFVNDMDESNIIDGKPVCYWINKQDMIVPIDVGYLAVVNSTNITIRGLELKNNYQGILLAYTKNSTIIDNNVATNLEGIHLWGSSGNNVSRNNIRDNMNGIILKSSYLNTLLENNVTNSGFCDVQLDWSHSNTISGNEMVASQYYGLRLLQSSDNVVFENRIENNQGGISLYSSSDNRFYHNFLMNNTPQVSSETSTNMWDNGYPSGGNYWSNYTDIDLYSGPYQNETGSDGIWDHPYVIDGSNRDNYPIVPEFSSLIILPLFMIATLLTVIVYKKKAYCRANIACKIT